MVRPLRRYKRYISTNVSPIFEAEHLAVFGLNSAHGWTIKGGRIRRDDLKRMRAFFDEQPGDQFRVLTLHHHLFLIEALMPHDISRRAEAALETAAACEVDLVLCGHLHQSHVHQAVVDDHPLVVASAGTATSSRGRRQDRRTNYFNLIRIEEDAFTIEEHRFEPEQDQFLVERNTTFSRAS